MQMKLEVVPVPVTDVDRAIDFYVEKLGFHLDMDRTVSDEIRFVQVTPPGSACSIHIGKNTSVMAPGSVKGLILVVDSVADLKAELETRGVEVSDIDPQPWGVHAYLSDPDGNEWTIQESFAQQRAAKEKAES